LKKIKLISVNFIKTFDFCKKLVAEALNSTGKELTFNRKLYSYKLTELEQRKQAYFEKLVNSRESVSKIKILMASNYKIIFFCINFVVSQNNFRKFDSG
jgi:hypothetical protein